MIENIRSVLVGLTKEYGGDEDSAALGYGLGLARGAGAHLTVQAAAQRLRLSSAWVTRFARDLVRAENARLHDLARAAAKRLEADAAAEGVTASVQSPQFDQPGLIASFTALARVHDISVIDAEPEAIHPDRDLILALLAQSGRPLLAVPPGREGFRADRVLIGWDASGRASRAAHDALPFLRAAEAVQVVVVTGEKALPDGADGSDLAAHLARHGVRVEAARRPAQGGDVAQTLRDAAGSFRADMIVVGGYVHSPLREMVFGGVTQSLLASSPVPLLLSH